MDKRCAVAGCGGEAALRIRVDMVVHGRTMGTELGLCCGCAAKVKAGRFEGVSIGHQWQATT